MVISRLLHTKLSQRSKAPQYLETLRNRLATLRRKLLNKIDKSMKDLDVSRDALVEDMCAFSFATSSSPKDVLRHFCHVRLEAISEHFREDGDTREGVSRAMQLYIRTLKDTKAIFPRLLAQALETLRSTPIINSKELYSLIELNLEFHERWVGDDIRTFTPYIRVDDLQKPESEDLLAQWAIRALPSFFDGVRYRIQSVTDTLEILDIRLRLFEIWFSNQRQSTAVVSIDMVGGLRHVFNDRWVNLIELHAASLESIASLILEAIQTYSSNVSNPREVLWDNSLLRMDLSNGGKLFREALAARSMGDNELLQTISQQYAAWLHLVQTMEDTIVRIEATKWSDDIIDYDEDDDVVNHDQFLLCEEDPRLLRQKCATSVEKAFVHLEAAVNAVVESLERYDGQKAAFLLRFWRDVRQRKPKCCSIDGLGLDSIAALQQFVAALTIQKPMQHYQKSVRRLVQESKLPGRLLWEGEPPLPVLPSPWAFHLLRDVVSSMASLGSDIWSVDMTDKLKLKLRISVVASVEYSSSKTQHYDSRAAKAKGEDENIPRHGDHEQRSSASAKAQSPTKSSASQSDSGMMENGLTNGNVSAPLIDPEVQSQLIFDLLYIDYATKTKHSQHHEDDLNTLRLRLETGIDLSAELMGRLEKGAFNYWTRTSLLFALLA